MKTQDVIIKRINEIINNVPPTGVTKDTKLECQDQLIVMLQTLHWVIDDDAEHNERFIKKFNHLIQHNIPGLS